MLQNQVGDAIHNCQAVVDQIIRLRAGCEDTLVIKAKAIGWCRGRRTAPVVIAMADDETDLRMVQSLLDDLLRRA